MQNRNHDATFPVPTVEFGRFGRAVLYETAPVYLAFAWIGLHTDADTGRAGYIEGG